MPLAKTYFLVPSPDYAPNALILLGQLISNPKTPYAALHPPHAPLPQVHRSTKYNWSLERGAAVSGSVGIFAKFLSVVSGVSADVEGNFSTGSLANWRAGELVTEFIVPSEEYVNASVRDVKSEYLKGVLGKDLYMITGVKIARGCSLMYETSQSVGAEVKLGFDATMFGGVPIEIGPKGGFERRDGDRQGFGASDDFVIAYRLRRVFVRAFSDKVRSREVRGGELLRVGGDDSDEDSVVDSEEEEEVDDDGKAQGSGQGPKAEEQLEVSLGIEDFGMRVLPAGFKRERVVDEDDEEECQLMF